MDDYLAVLTTTDKKADAERLAKAIVEERLAACLQIIGPIGSTYWWKGKLETAEEWLCFMKTRAALYPALERRLKELHPYETPQIVALPLVRGSAEYFAWIDEVLGSRPGDASDPPHRR